MTALEVRAFAWYLRVVLVGFSLLWVVVPLVVPTASDVANALLPTIVVFNALSLAVLARFPRLLRPVQVAQYASAFPFVLGFMALKIDGAGDPVAVHAAIAWCAIWIPVVVAVTFHVFGSRDGLVASLAFVGGMTALMAVALDRGTTLDGSGAAYVAGLVVASVMLAATVYGSSRLGERLAAARIEAAVAAEVALRDPLTGVYTRYALEERFDQELARARRGGASLAVYFMDLDGFKVVNDVHGHATGDALLRAFAQRVQGTVRGSDTIGRLGGDEFVVLASVAGNEEAHALADRLLASCALPVTLGGRDFHLSVSIGVAVHPHDGGERAALLRAADEAMYAAKAAGRNRWSAHARREPRGPRDPGSGGGSAWSEGAHRELAYAGPA